MQILSCEHPQRIYNKYLNEYVWVPCQKCNICRNRRAAKYSFLLERERSQHRYSFFVTLTYTDQSIPFISNKGFSVKPVSLKDCVFTASRLRDSFCIPCRDLFSTGDYIEKWHLSDYRYFYQYIHNDIYGGLPYASKTDAQLFLKRLNKFAHDKITHQFKNFRYFLVSEYGSTTFRPHFHAIFFVDSPEFADKFAYSVASCWKYGRVDIQPVENSACSYVAQYVNKSADLPYVYRNKYLSPFFLCSRSPFIGTMSERSEDDAKVVNAACPSTFGKRKASDIQFSDVPLQPSYQNRLFPKCPCYGSLSNSMRIRCYSAFREFNQGTLQGFLNKMFEFIYSGCRSEFCEWLYSRLSLSYNVLPSDYDGTNASYLFDEYSFNFLRRMYYCGRKVARQALAFGLSFMRYIHKIFAYYNNRDLYLLKKQYELQENISNSESPDSLALLYPEYLFNNGISYCDWIVNCSSPTVDCQLADAEYFAKSNKKTHFKNAYLDSLELRSEKFLFNLIKTYLYAKKCNETLEAFAPSGA